MFTVWGNGQKRVAMRGILVSASVAVLFAEACSQQPSKPHLVLFIADDVVRALPWLCFQNECNVLTSLALLHCSGRWLAKNMSQCTVRLTPMD